MATQQHAETKTKAKEKKLKRIATLERAETKKMAKKQVKEKVQEEKCVLPFENRPTWRLSIEQAPSGSFLGFPAQKQQLGHSIPTTWNVQPNKTKSLSKTLPTNIPLARCFVFAITDKMTWVEAQDLSGTSESVKQAARLVRQIILKNGFERWIEIPTPPQVKTVERARMFLMAGLELNSAIGRFLLSSKWQDFWICNKGIGDALTEDQQTTILQKLPYEPISDGEEDNEKEAANILQPKVMFPPLPPFLTDIEGDQKNESTLVHHFATPTEIVSKVDHQQEQTVYEPSPTQEVIYQPTPTEIYQATPTEPSFEVAQFAEIDNILPPAQGLSVEATVETEFSPANPLFGNVGSFLEPFQPIEPLSVGVLEVEEVHFTFANNPLPILCGKNATRKRKARKDENFVY